LKSKDRTALFFISDEDFRRRLFGFEKYKLKGSRNLMKKIAIIMGSDSDLPVAEKAINVLAGYGVPYEVHVFSAHRTPVEAKEFTVNARQNGFGAIIALAGMAAHLAGAIAANTTLPVVGVPVKSANIDGLDALLSTVQMPSGIPVATVAIDGAANAATLCVEMLAIEDAELAEKLSAVRAESTAKVLARNRAIEQKYNK
jgi:5-(carboxyamino)imidazole ribonucleotide mutase